MVLLKQRYRRIKDRVPIWIGRKMVGRFHGGYLLTAKRSDLFSDVKTPYDLRFGEPPLIPLGSVIEYHPISALEDQPRIQQVGRKFCSENYPVTHCMRENLERRHLW